MTMSSYKSKSMFCYGQRAGAFERVLVGVCNILAAYIYMR